MEEHYEDHEIILVDDGSLPNKADEIAAILSTTSSVRCLYLSKPSVFGIAAIAGLQSAIGDFSVILDPSTDSADEIVPIISKAIQGFDVVYGVDPNSKKRRGLGRLAESLFHWYVSKFVHVQVPRFVTSLRCFSRSAANALTDNDRAHTLYRYSNSVIGFRSAAFQYDVRPSHSTISKSLGEAINEGLEIILDNSLHPLRTVSKLGVALATLNLFYIGYVITTYLVRDDVVTGWATVSLQVSGLFLCVLLMLAAISEYVGRLISAAHRNPAYIIRGERSSSVMITDERTNVVTESGHAHTDYIE